MLSMGPYQGVRCPFDLPVCPFINDMLVNRSLVMNAFARLLMGSRRATMLFLMWMSGSSAIAD